VEAERYNPAPPKALPPDEHMTQTVRTDRVGTATVTLNEPGWWAVTAVRRAPGVTRVRDGRAYPVVERATFWVQVDDKPALKPVE
ncbi:MAG TPA: hypothetical protein VKD90_20325, partial [Gemmataceae bacterium]|nr:hypothetical protein [Gemmataceae bacterium]